MIRLLHRAHMLVIEGDSYRNPPSTRRKKAQAEAAQMTLAVQDLGPDQELHEVLMTKKTPKRKPRPGGDEYGRTPLHYAASDGDSGMVEALLRAAADPNAQDDNGWTALHFAAQAKSVSCVRALLAAGARVELRDSHGNTPLWRAVCNSRGEGEIIGMLRASGADPRAPNNHGVSPVRLARTIANYDVAQFFADVSEDSAT